VSTTISRWMELGYVNSVVTGRRMPQQVRLSASQWWGYEYLEVVGAGRCLSMKSITGPWKIIGKSRGIYSCNFYKRQQVNDRCLFEDHTEKLSPPHDFHQHSEKQTWAHMLKTPKFHDDPWTIHVCAHELPWKDRFKLSISWSLGWFETTKQIQT